MKRSDVYILINGEDGKKKVIKVNGYMFCKLGHWFTVRKNDPAICKTSYKGKWIVSDLVTGLVMKDTDYSLNHVPDDVLTESMISMLIGYYKDKSTSLYRRESTREEFQRYAQMINDAMHKDGQDKLIECLQDSAYELFN